MTMAQVKQLSTLQGTPLCEGDRSQPPESRAALAASLLETFEVPGDQGVEQAWKATIQRRMVEVDSGRVQTIPWSEVQRRVRRHLKGASFPGA